MEKGNKNHFVLVHGACHGAWCWYKVVTILRSEGHKRVVLVGHSLGGINISLAMEKFPHKIAVAVFVTASMPGPDLNLVAVTQQVCSN
ncbi:hypothetical protein KY289_016339 [Solanum tuberosum]|nr:hypothetical protein KY289_016339 [Solanum tuberosum]